MGWIHPRPGDLFTSPRNWKREHVLEPSGRRPRHSFRLTATRAMPKLYAHEWNPDGAPRLREAACWAHLAVLTSTDFWHRQVRDFACEALDRIGQNSYDNRARQSMASLRTSVHAARKKYRPKVLASALRGPKQQLLRIPASSNFANAFRYWPQPPGRPSVLFPGRRSCAPSTIIRRTCLLRTDRKSAEGTGSSPEADTGADNTCTRHDDSLKRQANGLEPQAYFSRHPRPLPTIHKRSIGWIEYFHEFGADGLCKNKPGCITAWSQSRRLRSSNTAGQSESPMSSVVRSEQTKSLPLTRSEIKV